MVKFIDAKEAAELIKDGQTLALGGFGSYCAPDELFKALADRFKNTNTPTNLTYFTGVSAGDFTMDDVGLNRLALEGLVKRIIAGHLGNPPKLGAMAAQNKVEGFTLPLGVVMHLFRAIAAKELGVVTHVGLGTFADPRFEGCKINQKAIDSKFDVVKFIEVDGKEALFYPSLKLDACFIRGTYADEEGNISVAHEALTGAELEMAAAVKACGGNVIVQVEKLVQKGSLKPREVRIHNSLVDYVVINSDPELHKQCYAIEGYRAELTGEAKVPVNALEPMDMSIRKVIARRGAMELQSGCIINLGIGIPSGVGAVANEEGIKATLSLESGPVGGVPCEGVAFAGSANAEVINSICDTFDLYDGGFLDMTFLGAAEIDKDGNVNVSKFGDRCTGPGGFINISQTTKKVYFMGGFTAGKSDIRIEDGKINIVADGPHIKFIDKVQQISFSADYAKKTGQEVHYITERAVFKLVDEGLLLIEIAPGVDLEKDILAHMNFKPLIADDLKTMDERIFKDARMFG